MGITFKREGSVAADSHAGLDTSRVDVPSLTLTPNDPLYPTQTARIADAQDINASRAMMDSEFARQTNLVHTSGPTGQLAGNSTKKVHV